MVDKQIAELLAKARVARDADDAACAKCGEFALIDDTREITGLCNDCAQNIVLSLMDAPENAGPVARKSSFIPHEDPHTGEILYTQHSAADKALGVVAYDAAAWFDANCGSEDYERNRCTYIAVAVREAVLRNATPARDHMVYAFECTRYGESPHWRQYDTREEAERFRTEQLSYGRPCGEIREMDCGLFYDEDNLREIAAERKRWLDVAKALISSLQYDDGVMAQWEVSPHKNEALRKLIAMVEETK